MPILIGSVALVAMVAPVMYIHKTRKNKETSFISRFNELAMQNNVNIAQPETWNIHYAMGLDAAANKILYLKKNENQENMVVIDLRQVERCRVANKTHQVKSNGKNIAVTDSLHLAFILKDKSKADKTVEFYNGDESLCLRGELPLVEKWCDLINQQLKKK